MVEEAAPAAPVRANPEHLRRDMYRLALDWVDLASLPAPPAPPGRRAKHRDYGHPRAWASDIKADITDMLSGWHEAVAEMRSETPPPAPPCAEVVRVVAAWQYLEPRIEWLCSEVEAEALREIGDLHHRIRRVLGYSNPPSRIFVPCNVCGQRRLLRFVRAGASTVRCGHCGWVIDDDEYQQHRQFFARVALEALDV